MIKKMLMVDPNERLDAHNVVDTLGTIQKWVMILYRNITLIILKLQISYIWQINLEICYDRKKCIGEGGFAQVFEGNWGKSWLKVAVKRIQLPSKEKEKEKSKREENALRALEHPNIVKLYHVEEDENFK